MIQLLQSPWTAVLVGTVTYWSATYLLLARQHFTRPPSAAEEEAGPGRSLSGGPSWDFRNPEVESLITELKMQRDELGKRERELKELQVRVSAERQEITQATQAVWRLRLEVDSATGRTSSEDAASFKRLARDYASMSPDGAARLLSEMDEDQSVRVLAAMKDTESAIILETLGKGGPVQARRASALADRLRQSVLASAASGTKPTP